jgi:hypothetical protein
MADGNQPTGDHWTVDRRIPLALILAIVVQTGGIVWWAASASERLNNLEKKVELAGPHADRLTRVEVKLETVQEGITEIKRLIQTRPPALQ